MWWGIGAIIFSMLPLLVASYWKSHSVGISRQFQVVPGAILLFVLWVLGVTLVTGGLIFTLKDKSKDEQ